QPHELKALGVARPRPGVTVLHPTVELPEDPRVGECPAADRYAVTTGIADHPRRVRNAPHVAVTEHRDAFDRFDHAADAVVVHAAGEALFAGAPVDRDRRDP